MKAKYFELKYSKPGFALSTIGELLNVMSIWLSLNGGHEVALYG